MTEYWDLTLSYVPWWLQKHCSNVGRRPFAKQIYGAACNEYWIL